MGEIIGEFGISVYTVLYFKWISNKDLLYSTSNSTQFSSVNYMGKESKKKECLYLRN